MQRVLCAVGVVICLLAVEAKADDWPQWMGPQRDNVWRESGILAKFPEGGPKIAWRAPVSGGYAGPAVANGRVFVTDYVAEGTLKDANFQRKEFTGNERVLCLDQATGKELWKHEYPVKYTISYPAGPRCTPTVDGNRVYTLGAEGDLLCLDVETGKVIWSKNLPEEYHTKTALWGYSNHPLIDGQKLITFPGGEGSYAVAWDKNTGKELWRSLTAPDQTYAPPSIILAGGRRQLLVPQPNALSSVDPETGREYWSEPYDATNGLVTMSPILWQNYLYIGGHDKRNLMLELAILKLPVEIVWKNVPQHGISPINVQPLVEGDTMYGFDEDGRLYGIALPSGDRLWNTTAPLGDRPANSGTAMIVRQGDRYWLFTEHGDLIIAKFSPTAYEEIDRAHVIEPTNDAWGRNVVWCAPAYANRHMFVRNDKECISVDLTGK
jgi:outer membrane protein assembly factor BamB